MGWHGLDSSGSGLGQEAGQALVNTAQHLWEPLYAGNLTSYGNATFQVLCSTSQVF
jgi:hypothetical protein